MRYLALFVALFSVVIIGTPQVVQAHCEIPCGIFDDEARFDLLLEHAQTIEKSMDKINELSEAEDEDYHTIIRWTMNKEKHAQEVQDIAAQYFLAQRVKTPALDAPEEQINDYQIHTVMLHKIIVAAMKTKQSTDTKRVETLRALINSYRDHYYKGHDKEYNHKH